jgi:hypothetical protein
MATNTLSLFAWPAVECHPQKADDWGDDEGEPMSDRAAKIVRVIFVVVGMTFLLGGIVALV